MRRLRRILFVALALSIVGYLAWDRVEAVRWSRLIAAIQAHGEPVSVDFWEARRRTPEQAEAARLYGEAADLAREKAADDNNRTSRLDVDKPGGTEISLPEIEASYRSDDPALQLLDRATPLAFQGFDAEYGALYENANPLLELGSLACLRADLLAVRGDGDGAAAALVPAVRLQRTLKLPAYRARHASRLLGSFRILLRHGSPDETRLTALQRAFDDWPDEDALLEGLMLDRARAIDAMDDRPPGLAAAAAIRLLHPFMTRAVRLRVASFDEAIAIAREPWPARWEAAGSIDRRIKTAVQRRPGTFTLLLSGGFPVGLAQMSLRDAALDLAARRIAAATIAVERYRRAHDGAPPASLAALTPAFLASVPKDPFSAEPLVYRSDSGGYVIYSVDSNRRDDHGAMYGHGSAVAVHVGPQSPRDFGIRVPLEGPR